MKKLNVRWEPELEQDFEAMTNPNSPFYDKDYSERILTEYQSLENFKKSDAWKKLEKKYYG